MKQNGEPKNRPTALQWSNVTKAPKQRKGDQNVIDTGGASSGRSMGTLESPCRGLGYAGPGDGGAPNACFSAWKLNRARRAPPQATVPSDAGLSEAFLRSLGGKGISGATLDWYLVHPEASLTPVDPEKLWEHTPDTR